MRRFWLPICLGRNDTTISSAQAWRPLFAGAQAPSRH
jgi:hypothetical protein